MLVLGIDPGSRRTGWGLIEERGTAVVMRDMGVIRPGDGLPLEARLAAIHAGVAGLLGSYGPECVGIECVFHGVNTKALVTLGQARGAAMAAVGAGSRTLIEITPAEIKKALTGNGQATKEQVAHMVGVLLGPEVRERISVARKLSAAADATDALAIAIASLHRRAAPQGRAAPLGRAQR
jgi:crossover junction endodeoxyribonuclease RuvC